MKSQRHKSVAEWDRRTCSQFADDLAATVQDEKFTFQELWGGSIEVLQSGDTIAVSWSPEQRSAKSLEGYIVAATQVNRR